MPWLAGLPLAEKPRMNVTTAKTEAEMEKKQGVCHTVALPFTIKKSILRQKKNNGNSKYFTMQKPILQKIL
jgi:hypothetical protein